MKTKDLIKLLQEEDPSGETEVVIDDGRDIFYLDTLPGYWDGNYTTLIRDSSKKPYYDIIGAKYRSDGTKIKIKGMSWEDVLENDPDFSIEVIDIGVYKKMQKEVDKYREEIKEINEKFKKKFKFKIDIEENIVQNKEEYKLLNYIFSIRFFYY